MEHKLGAVPEKRPPPRATEASDSSTEAEGKDEVEEAEEQLQRAQRDSRRRRSVQRRRRPVVSSEETDERGSQSIRTRSAAKSLGTEEQDGQTGDLSEEEGQGSGWTQEQVAALQVALSFTALTGRRAAHIV